MKFWILGAATLALGACGMGAGRPLLQGEAARIHEIGALVPLADHHQHLMSADAAIPVAPPLPAASLPPELAAVLVARNAVMGDASADELFRDDVRILKLLDDGQPWEQGREAASDMIRAYTPDSRFEANTYAIDGSAAYLAGVSYTGDNPVPDMNFFLGLKRNEAGRWQIAAEYATLIPPASFGSEIGADRLIRNLDDAGIPKAVVLSVAYWFGEAGDRPGDEYTSVRRENDWVASEVARYPDRLVWFCSFSPLRDYALRELERCATDLGTSGLKLHFGSSRVDVHNPEHLRRVRAVFEAANRYGLPIVVHSRSGADYGRAEAETFVRDLLPAAADVPVQIAHLWGGGQYSSGALAVFAEAVSSGDPAARNLIFDLTEVERAVGGSESAAREVVERMREIGMDRMFYGSDMEAGATLSPALGWAQFRSRMPLTVAELRTIANNRAPYLRN